MGVTSFPVSQVCGQAKGTESRAGSKNAAKYPLLNPKSKEGLFLPKTFGCEETVLLQAPAREVQVSFGVQEAELPWENNFAVIPTSAMFLFQCLFTVNYCFRLYPFLLSFFPRQLLGGT